VGRTRAGVTLAIVLVPFAGLGVAVWLAWGHGLGLADVLLALAFYAATGLGVTVGFHRLLTHRAFTAARPLRAALAIAGSMSFEGDVIGWVAIHRHLVGQLLVPCVRHQAIYHPPPRPLLSHRQQGYGPCCIRCALAFARGWPASAAACRSASALISAPSSTAMPVR
jgi:hypothetical protein